MTDTIRLRVWGDFACFTRPEMKVERVSYDVMTPSAARGVLEAILWKPEMRWEVSRIDVLRPVRFFSVRRNEVQQKTSASLAKQVMGGGSAALEIKADDPSVRVQRASLVLRDVDYIIHARPLVRPEARADNREAKYRDMFTRRARRGQCFHRPYLGCREFPASFALADPAEDLDPIAETRDLGWMLHDLDFTGDEPQPRFFRAQMDRGSVAVPAWSDEALRS